MDRRIFVWVFGLIGLFSLSSCEDHFSFDDKKEFMPVGYQAKNPDTLLIVGIDGLVFDEVEKNDWKIISQHHTNFRGREKLTVNQMIDLTGKESAILDIETNYGTIPLTFANLEVTYEYMGKPLVLKPIHSLQLIAYIENDKVIELAEHYIHSGDIVYMLVLDGVILSKHSQTFAVSDTYNPE